MPEQPDTVDMLVETVPDEQWIAEQEEREREIARAIILHLARSGCVVITPDKAATLYT